VAEEATLAEGMPPVRRRRRVLIGAGVLLVVVVVAAVVFVHWLHSLKVPVGGGFEFGLSRPVGTTFYVPDVLSADEKHPVAVDFQSVVPVIRRNTADARVTVLSCVHTSAVEAIGFPHMPSCTRATPFRAGILHLSDRPGGDGIAVRITLRHPGRLVIDGFRMSYSDGIRSGSTTSGPTITARATAPTS
jgi:hypothetical protein